MGFNTIGSIRCKCGRDLTVRTDSKLAFCPCGERNVVENVNPYQPEIQGKPTCNHRSSRVGQGSCGCGSFHLCNLDGRYCSLVAPRDELYTITLNLDSGGHLQLSEENYRCCSGCNHFSPRKTQ